MKIHNIFFFDILCDVYYHLVKFEFKIPLMHGEIKRQIQLGGRVNWTKWWHSLLYLLACCAVGVVYWSLVLCFCILKYWPGHVILKHWAGHMSSSFLSTLLVILHFELIDGQQDRTALARHCVVHLPSHVTMSCYLGPPCRGHRLFFLGNQEGTPYWNLLNK